MNELPRIDLQIHTDEPRGVDASTSETLAPIITSWIGTSLAGGVFGIPYAGVAGFLFGTFFAAQFGLFVYVTIASLMHLLWQGDRKALLGAVAGGTTGLATAYLMWQPFIFYTSLPLTTVLAAILGAIGGTMGAQRAPQSRNAKKRRVRSPRRNAIESAIRLSTAVAIVLGWAWVLVPTLASVTTLTVPRLKARFAAHTSEFQAIAELARTDGQFAILRDQTVSQCSISPERRREYLNLLKKAELQGSYVVFHPQDEAQIDIMPQGRFVDGFQRSYIYSEVALPATDASTNEVEIERKGQGTAHCVPLGENWYLEIRPSTYRDSVPH
ncbi:MAG: hypothetical protein KDA61_19620 [Planctomycetales bacterium]|nr:hypothetical protein [Planctomycetales bacterium]